MIIVTHTGVTIIVKWRVIFFIEFETIFNYACRGNVDVYVKNKLNMT